MNRIIAYIAIVAIFLTSCSKIAQSQDDDNIRLVASVENVTVTTRATRYADTFEGSVPTPSNPLESVVLFSMVPGEYRHEPVSPTSLPCHTTIRYESSVLTDPDPWEGNNLRYPTSDAPVYCVGLYPKTGWVISDDGRKATYPDLDGYTDLMYAEQITGKWSDHFGAQTYEHLLSWIKVCVVAVDSDAPLFWGDVKRISIENSSQVEVVLYDAENDGSKVSYSGNTSTVAFDGACELTTSIKEIGSVLCTPARSYVVNVTTEEEERSVEVTLVDKNGNPLASYEDAMGKQFIIELYFHPFSIIEGDCSLQSWEYKEDNFYLN